MARRRSRRPRTQFRAWGWLLAFTALILASADAWWEAASVGGILVLYLLFVRLTRCRVETRFERPCRWLVRGMMGTCTYHVGDKRGLPVLIAGERFAGFPTLMWRREAGAQGMGRPEQQPEQTASDPHPPGYNRAGLALTVLGVAIAGASFVRDLLAG